MGCMTRPFLGMQEENINSVFLIPNEVSLLFNILIHVYSSLYNTYTFRVHDYYRAAASPCPGGGREEEEEYQAYLSRNTLSSNEKSPEKEI